MLASPTYDIAAIADLGQRDEQEDAIVARIFDAANAGYVVVADGMGGHQAGDVASDLVVSAWCAVLDEQLDRAEAIAGSALMDALPLAAMEANASIAGYSEENGGELSMGSTLLGTLFLNDRMFWISIGDSPLYLFRDGVLSQINEDHSMAPLIDAQAADGRISVEEAQVHPDRNQLTSVIMGAAIPKVDCPQTPLQLQRGDIVLLASDGLQYLDHSAIQTILREQGDRPAHDIANALLGALHRVQDPDQDNISISVVKPIIL